MRPEIEPGFGSGLRDKLERRKAPPAEEPAAPRPAPVPAPASETAAEPAADGPDAAVFAALDRRSAELDEKEQALDERTRAMAIKEADAELLAARRIADAEAAAQGHLDAVAEA